MNTEYGQRASGAKKSPVIGFNTKIQRICQSNQATVGMRLEYIDIITENTSAETQKMLVDTEYCLETYAIVIKDILEHGTPKEEIDKALYQKLCDENEMMQIEAQVRKKMERS